ncbi:hypothetical protein CMK11_01065 [Candidatus Poribacteria bacterium]|nr:hypothetical protein [Candidatus Poribacteria bacterium]
MFASPRHRSAAGPSYGPSSRSDGKAYIEGDQSCLPEQEDHYWYHEFVSKLPGGDRGQWNYDVTLSVEMNARLMTDAGFSDVRQTWKARGDDGYGHAVLVAARQ